MTPSIKQCQLLPAESQILYKIWFILLVGYPDLPCFLFSRRFPSTGCSSAKAKHDMYNKHLFLVYTGIIRRKNLPVKKLFINFISVATSDFDLFKRPESPHHLNWIFQEARKALRRQTHKQTPRKVPKWVMISSLNFLCASWFLVVFLYESGVDMLFGWLVGFYTTDRMFKY